MYLANRVKETTTTTGTGNVTLAGAVTGFKTFTSQYANNVYFPYWIQASNDTWECGIGYLSASTTLVRTQVLDNSSGSLTAISLPSGTHDVYVNAVSSQTGSSTWGDIDTGTANDALLRSAHWGGGLGTPTSISGSYAYWVPFYLAHSGYYDGVGVIVSTGAGIGTDEWHVGIYTREADGLPGERLEGSTSTALDFSSTGLKVHTFTKRHLPAGWYFTLVAGAQGVSPSVVGPTGSSNPTTSPSLGSDASSTNYADQFRGYYVFDNTDITTTPADGSAVTNSSLSKTMPLPWVFLRVAP